MMLLWWLTDWKGNTCDRAVFLNARVYVMAQCKGHAGTLSRGDQTLLQRVAEM
jgi:hypothetical protein